MERIMAQEGMGFGTKTVGVIKAILSAPSRFVARGFDDVGENIIRNQREAYEDEIIEAIINPDRAVELRQYFDKLNPKFYYYTQALARGGAAAIDEIFLKDQARLNEIKKIEQNNPSFGPFEKEPQVEPTVEPPISNLQGAIDNFQMPNVSGNAFGATDPAMAASPTLLPDERDREIAMRQQGIASLT
jgi:hypothetical protein